MRKERRAQHKSEQRQCINAGGRLLLLFANGITYLYCFCWRRVSQRPAVIVCVYIRRNKINDRPVSCGCVICVYTRGLNVGHIAHCKTQLTDFYALFERNIELCGPNVFALLQAMLIRC